MPRRKYTFFRNVEAYTIIIDIQKMYVFNINFSPQIKMYIINWESELFQVDTESININALNTQIIKKKRSHKNNNI